MKTNTHRRFWKPLGIFAMVTGLLVLAYLVLALFMGGDQALMGVFILIVGLPALVPAILGYFMYKGSTAAAWTLRISIILTLISALVLDLAMGLDVLSFAPVAVPLVAGGVLWLGLSFV